MLIVPESLNRNSKRVRDMGDPADTGAMLIEYMCERIGIENLEGLDVLDFGCGVRFSQAIINRELLIGSYTGVEAKENIVSFLRENVSDPRFTYHHINAANQFYNPTGQKLDSIEDSWLEGRKFDIACMFSVITHQRPEEADAIFAFLRDHIRPSGNLFFSAFIHDEGPDYQELTPDSPGLRSSYKLSKLVRILEFHDWEINSIVGPRPKGLPIMSSLHCRVGRYHRLESAGT